MTFAKNLLIMRVTQMGYTTLSLDVCESSAFNPIVYPLLTGEKIVRLIDARESLAFIQRKIGVGTNNMYNLTAKQIGKLSLILESLVIQRLDLVALVL